jgi:regulation of enolase protein 1 (concanavalin A-like superfamily)
LLSDSPLQPDPESSLAEFAALTSRYFAGGASPGEVDALREQLRADARKRSLYIAICLQGRFIREVLPERVTQEAARRVSPRLVRFAAAAAVVLAFVGGVALLLNVSKTPPQQIGPQVASLVDAADAVWDSPAPIRVGDPLRNGWLKLVSGTAQVAFASGAEVTLTGPAEFGLNDRNRGFLRRGRLVTSVPASAHGFTIGAPGCAVVDLGTRFGMTVSDTGRTEVHVLVGKVRIDTADGKPPVQLAVGASRRIEASGEVTVIDAAPPQPAAEPAPQPLIAVGKFDELSLSAFNVVRPDPANYRVSDGRLTVQTQRGDLAGHGHDARNVFDLAAPAGDFTVTLGVERFEPTQKPQNLSLCVIDDESNLLRVVYWQRGGGRAVNLVQKLKDEQSDLTTAPVEFGAKPFSLRLTRRGERVLAAFSADGVTWIDCGEAAWARPIRSIAFYASNSGMDFKSVPLVVSRFEVTRDAGQGAGAKP